MISFSNFKLFKAKVLILCYFGIKILKNMTIYIPKRTLNYIFTSEEKCFHDDIAPAMTCINIYKSSLIKF